MNGKILVADDDPAIREIFDLILTREGFITELKDGGGDLFLGNFNIPDLFLIDKMLSGTDGLDVCRHLKQHPATRLIPVIMVSALPDIASLSKLAGADNYIEKPFDTEALLNMVRQYIPTSGKEDQAASISQTR